LARYIGSVCRLCRREGLKLFLKGDRCFTEKCSVERRNYPPGQHGQSRPKNSNYGLQLREKQKAKRVYGVLENQFRAYFKKAARKPGVTGKLLLTMLETRLDNVIYRLGFASSRNGARQLIKHGHLKVNGRKVDIPSYQVRQGDVIELREKSKKVEWIKESMESAIHRGLPQWLELVPEKFTGVVKSIPERDDVTMQIQEQLIVELYSK
jgi:small subunit ribosomal protein S4